MHLFKSLTATKKPADPCICLILCVFMVSVIANYAQITGLVSKHSVWR